jgi:hypothetical protein
MTTAEGKTLPSCIELWIEGLLCGSLQGGIPVYPKMMSWPMGFGMLSPLILDKTWQNLFCRSLLVYHRVILGSEKGWCHLQVPSIYRVQVAFYRIIRNRKGMWYWRSWNAITWTFVNFGQQITVPLILVIEILEPQKSFQIIELPTDRVPKFNVSRFTHDRGELSKWVALEVRWLCCRSLATPKSNNTEATLNMNWFQISQQNKCSNEIP